jgi:hypothetical protein
MNWVKGPLGFPASEDKRYWLPETEPGKHRAWYHPNGLPGADRDRLLGEDLNLEAAKMLCVFHSSLVRDTTADTRTPSIDNQEHYLFIKDALEQRIEMSTRVAEAWVEVERETGTPEEAVQEGLAWRRKKIDRIKDALNFLKLSFPELEAMPTRLG